LESPGQEDGRAEYRVTACPSYPEPLARVYRLDMRPIFEPEFVRNVCIYNKRGISLSPAAESFKDFLFRFVGTQQLVCILLSQDDGAQEDRPSSSNSTGAWLAGSVALAARSAASGKLPRCDFERTAMLNTKGMRFPIDVILVCIRWYAAYPLIYRHLKEMMQERGDFVAHSSIHRWAIRFLPWIEKMARQYKRPVGASWRMDATYVNVNGVWKYLYRAAGKDRRTVDFPLTAKRDAASARRFFDRVMKQNGTPDG
jgi:hypothetical protein